MIKRFITKTNSEEYNLLLQLTQDYNNIGLYTPTDGDVGHIDLLTSFIVKTNSVDNTVELKDGIDTERYEFLRGLSYTIDWGDNSISSYSVNGLSNTHTYINQGSYIVTITIDTPWGIHKQSKTITVPSIDTVTFNPTIITPESLGYDSQLIQYVNLTNEIICANVQSRLNELKLYGTTEPTVTITDADGENGINGVAFKDTEKIVYYIDRLKYVDYIEDDSTIVSLEPQKFTSGDVIDGVEYINEMLNVYDGPVVHQEVFKGVTGDIELQSDIFIDRGKQAPFEYFYKLGEVSNIKEMEKNGNNFFTINNVDDFKL